MELISRLRDFIQRELLPLETTDYLTGRVSTNLTWQPGNLTRRQFADRYAERAGRPVSNILYYYVFGLFKNAVVIQQIYSRYKQGLTKDERFAGLLAGVGALSSTGVKAIDTGTL